MISAFCSGMSFAQRRGMVRSALAVSAVIFASFIVACSSNGTTASPATVGAACSYVAPVPAAPASSTTNDYGELPSGMTVQAYAEAQGLAYLDSFVGTYLRGDVTLYTGTLQASDNQSVLGDDCGGGSTACKNGSITEGPAIASLVVSQGIATLSVHSLSEHDYVVFTQSTAAAGVTNVGIVLPDTSEGGNTGTCKGCVPSFSAKPSSITFKNLVSTGDVAVNPGQGNVDGGVTDANAGAALSTHASASLTLATACALTFDDLIELNSLNGLGTSNNTLGSANTSSTFTQQGNDMVAEVQSTVYSYTGEQDCSTSYTIELYVNLTNLADYGVRNFQTYTPDAGYYYEPACP